MRDIDQFIDEQLFKNSDQYKLIYEQVEQELEKTRKENLGNASELLAYSELCKKTISEMGEENVSCSPSVVDARKEATKFMLQNLDGSNIIEKEAQNHADYLFNQTYFKREFYGLNLKPKKAEISFVGSKESGKSSGDVQVIFHFDNPEYPSTIFKASLKRGNKMIYQSSQYRTDLKSIEKLSGEYNLGLPNQEELDIKLLKSSGGGLIKMIRLFGSPRNLDAELAISSYNDKLASLKARYANLLKRQPIDTEKEKNYRDAYTKIRIARDEKISKYMEIFSRYLSKELKEKTEKDKKISNLINLFYNLLTRGDPDVKVYSNLISFSDKGNLKILFTPLMNAYVGHISTMSIDFNKESANPIINFGIKNVSNFSQSLTTKEKTLNANLKSSLEELKKELNNAIVSRQQGVSEQENQKFNNLNSVLAIFGIDKTNLEKPTEQTLNLLFKNLVSKANKEINNLKDKNVFQIKYKIFKKEIDTEGDSGRLEVYVVDSGFNSFVSFLNKLYELENNEDAEIKKILALINQVFTASKDSEEPKETINESLLSLISEALDEKEHQKVMKKIMSSGAKGLISAIPSNKTNNSIAVRFDSEDTIEAGIKKVKSSLRSAGYQLDDKRVLKFDQNRDTTDVIKNGEVVGRLFYRVDVKERKGLAYEHILGAVLTSKITDQLKNRIDLGPDASKEDVMSKLNSEEFKPLFDSAKKAAPLIKQKVGKVVRAESVGSTNNKADFVLTTAHGETVGLSAKYAAGDKDNEYKMNKVLGFGTEEDSLVYNPKMVPWWVVGRKTFLEKLKKNSGGFSGREYDPDYEDLDAPAWMKTAKESHPDVYKETMEEVYGQIRNVLTRNLRRMKFKDLVSFVMEADLGKEEERGNYDKFLKVMDGPSGLSVTELDINGGDVGGIDPRKLNPEQVVVQDRSDIIIRVPGFDELKINSVKFKSDMLSSKAGDLKIKTR
jgi:hypothetical protein